MLIVAKTMVMYRHRHCQVANSGAQYSTSGEQKNRELTSGPARLDEQGGPTPRRMMSIQDGECDYAEDRRRSHQPLWYEESVQNFPVLKCLCLWSESLNTVPSLSICSAHT